MAPLQSQSEPLMSEEKDSHTVVHNTAVSESEWDELPSQQTKQQAAISYCRRVLSYAPSILPGFLTSYAYAPRKTTPTSYLVALRGYAACIVVIGHIAYGPKDVFVKYPFIRTFMYGAGMVDVFFVISGYVLSYRMLQHTRDQQPAKLIYSLAGSTFRRYMRLFLPTGLTSFIYMLFGWFNLTYEFSTEVFPTFGLNLWHWLKDFFYSSNPFHNVDGYWNEEATYRTAYAYQMWTIPVEFRGSMIVFLYCAGLCMLSSKSRLSVCAATIFVTYIWGMTYVALFLGGMVYAELALIREANAIVQVALAREQHTSDHEQDIELQSRSSSMDRPKLFATSSAGDQMKTLLFRATCVLLLVLGWYLLGSPFNNPLPPLGWPGGSEHFWPGIGAFFFIFALDNFPALQTPLLWGFSQYLGEISFGIYAMHFVLIWSLYEGVLGPWHETLWGGSDWNFIPIMAVLYFVVFWLADYFNRADAQFVRFGHFLQKRYFVRWG